MIFLEGDSFAMDFACLTEIKDEQTALSFHFYPTVWDASLYNPDYPRKDRKAVFEERFCGMLEDMNRFGRPLLCGEAGYDIEGHGLLHVMEMVEDTLDLFAKYQISWTLWCYKDAQFMGLVYPGDESPWMQFAGRTRINWTHYKERRQGEAIVEQMSVGFPGEVSENIKYQLQFRQRAILSTLQKEQLLKPQLMQWGWNRVKEMPASFRFKNCGFYEEYRNLIKKYGVQNI